MRTLSERIRQALQRDYWRAYMQQMWLPIVFAAGLGLTICLEMANFPHPNLNMNRDGLIVAKLFFLVGYALSTLLQLTKVAIIWNERDKALPLKIVLHVVCYVILLVDIVWIWHHPLSIVGKIAHGVMYGSLTIGFFVLPMLSHLDDKHIPRFFVDTCTTYSLFAIVFYMVIVALGFLAFGIGALFGTNFSAIPTVVLEIFLYPLILIGTLGAAIVVLLLLPSPHKEGMVSTVMNKVSLLMGKYIFVPIFALYMLVLYAYILKVIFMWELPNGSVTWMTTIMMVALLSIVFLLYPILYGKSQDNESPSRFWLIVRRVLPCLVLPVLVLMSIGIARRVSDYGWTIARVYVLLANVWFYLVCGMLIVASYKEKKVLSQIIVSFCLIALLSSVIPSVNIAQSTQRVLHRQVETLISNAPIPFPAQPLTSEELSDWLDKQDEATANAIYSKLKYLDDTYGRESVEAWCGDVSYSYVYSPSIQE